MKDIIIVGTSKAAFLHFKSYNKLSNDRKNNFNIKLIYTNFSKNRINDSINRRGMSKKNTQNFEIEIPHQIYLADYILGENNKKEIIFKEQKDFMIDNICIEKHGYGKILLEYNDKIVRCGGVVSS